MLRAPRTFGDIARVGPIRHQADRIHDFIVSDKTGVLAVALPEEMPVNETLEYSEEIADFRGDAGRGGRERAVPGALHRRGDRVARTVTAGPAVRAAVTEHRRYLGQQAGARAAEERGGNVPLASLPFLFAPELGLQEVEDAVARARGAARVSVAHAARGARTSASAPAQAAWARPPPSAAIAVGMAQRGLKVAVLTIDPARRLANSLGLPELGNEERRIELDAPGELWAMMLDAKSTFDEIVAKHAPDASTRDAVLSNRIYKELSTAVAGSQEYMAMEKLHELHAEGRYDLLVLDTPPTRNALDFLDAPDRLSRFIDSRSLQFFLAPSRTGLKMFSRGTGLIFSILKRITGVDLLQDLSDFFASFGDMAQGFRERAKAVKQLLADDRTTFLLVTSPAHEADRGGEVLPRQARGGRDAVRRRDREPDARGGRCRRPRACPTASTRSWSASSSRTSRTSTRLRCATARTWRS